jgi:hypothetical protein
VLADTDVADIRYAIRAREDAPLANHDARPCHAVRSTTLGHTFSCV